MTVDFGVARAVDVQSFGEPGQRTFRLRLLGAKSQSASLWLEKEHLGALGITFRRVLSQVGFGGEPQTAEASDFPDEAEQDFRVGIVGIGFDPSNQTVILQFGEAGMQEEAALRVRLSLGHCASLIERLDEIVAGGRPICPLCGVPMEPSGHVCIRSNGHTQQRIPDSGAAEEDSD